MLKLLPKDWRKVLIKMDADTSINLCGAGRDAYRTETVYPPQEDLFSAFTLTPLSEVKVVIVGQDPYHGEGQAHGLAFSVPDGIAIPPSLRNIFKEIQDDIGTSIPKNGNLTRWAKQGVLLLNSSLTVRGGTAASHRHLNWEQFTNAVIAVIVEEKEPCVFMLWGAHAQSKSSLISKTGHLVLTASHPSPLSAHRGFLGCRHFSKCNGYLVEKNKTPINW